MAQEIYWGERGDAFRETILSVLRRADLKEKYVQKLTDKEGMKQYSIAFTSETASPDNYEVFEQLGDLSINKFIVWYSYRRFPQIYCPNGVKIAARLRINYGSKGSLYKIANDLGFWPFISSSMEEREHSKRNLLEDCMESFIGCTEFMLDRDFMPGIGYPIVYTILKSIFDEKHISLKYEDLFDAKTILKELFDSRKDLGEWKIVDGGPVESGKSALALQIINRKQTVIGRGTGNIKSEAEQAAAAEALQYFKRLGISKPVAKIYRDLCVS